MKRNLMKTGITNKTLTYFGTPSRTYLTKNLNKTLTTQLVLETKIALDVMFNIKIDETYDPFTANQLLCSIVPSK